MAIEQNGYVYADWCDRHLHNLTSYYREKYPATHKNNLVLPLLLKRLEEHTYCITPIKT